MDLGSLLGTKATVALAIIFFQQWLKRQSWFPLLTYESKSMNHLFSIAMAGLGTLGIHFTWNAGDHSLMITGLAVPAIATGMVHWVQQYLMTKVGYVALQSQLNPPAAQQPMPVVVVPGSKQP